MKPKVVAVSNVRKKWLLLKSDLNEVQRRHWCAAEAIAYGRGGIAILITATGMARDTIAKAIAELNSDNKPPPGRIRKKGGGRKSLTAHYPGLRKFIEKIVTPDARGDPQSPLRWTLKSTTSIAKLLGEKNRITPEGLSISPRTVATLLREMKFSLQLNRRVKSDGAQHPDRDAQFLHIARRAAEGFAEGIPVLSIDTKKTELVGNYANKGRTWNPKGKPVEVRDHEFYNDRAPKAHPYGIYDVKRNTGFVCVGRDHDTAQFAVSSLRSWWRKVGSAAYPGASRLQLMADCGGSNSIHARLWKAELQRLSNETGLRVCVSHYPPGTSKWNAIEHRLFSFISVNWRGEPLSDYETILNLIRATTNSKGLRVDCELDESSYPLGQRISDAELTALNLHPDTFHREWNYEVRPQKT
jgi:hypothetical protein